MAGGSSLVMFRASKRKPAAWKLIEFLSRPEQQVRFFELTGDLPARREAWNDPALAREPCTRAFGEQLQRTASWPKVPEWEEIAIRLQQQAERAASGEVAPDSALTALDRDVDRMLAKRRWLIERRHGLPPRTVGWKP
jgi:multiple sugar transport system substrate-binding protein